MCGRLTVGVGLDVGVGRAVGDAVLMVGALVDVGACDVGLCVEGFRVGVELGFKVAIDDVGLCDDGALELALACIGADVGCADTGLADAGDAVSGTVVVGAPLDGVAVVGFDEGAIVGNLGLDDGVSVIDVPLGVLEGAALGIADGVALGAREGTAVGAVHDEGDDDVAEHRSAQLSTRRTARAMALPLALTYACSRWLTCYSCGTGLAVRARARASVRRKKASFF